jgi:Cu(I)/Ag(I) efflux system protein CusF
MLKLTRIVLLATSALMVGGSAYAEDMKDMKGMNMSKATDEQAEGMGVIKAVDKTAATITISHEPIKAFNWPAMNMKFKVVDSKLLDGVQVGNKVQFTLQGKDMMKSQVTALKIVN